MPFADEFTITVDGLKELELKLKTLPEKMEKRLLRQALREGGQLILSAIKAGVRRTSGEAHHTSTGKPRPHLVDDLKIRIRTKDGLPVAHIGAGQQTAYIARFLELTGTAPHLIPKEIEPGKAVLIAGGHPVLQVQHPGTSPKPFIRPAFDSQYLNALNRFRDFLRERLGGLL